MNDISLPSIGSWQTYFNEEKISLEQLDKHGVLGHHVDSLARMFSIIKNVGLKKEDCSFLEIGAGDYIGKFFVDYDRKEPFSGLFTSNVANFFLLNQDNFDYFGVDPVIDNSILERYPQLFSSYMRPLKEKAKQVTQEGKVPVIFSNLVLGYYNKRFDGQEEKTSTGFSINPKFWDIPSLQVHQYLLRDLVSREVNIDEVDKVNYITKLTAPILELGDKQYNAKVEQLVQSAYGLDVPIISGKTGSEERANSMSVWINKY